MRGYLFKKPFGGGNSPRQNENIEVKNDFGTGNSPSQNKNSEEITPKILTFEERKLHLFQVKSGGRNNRTFKYIIMSKHEKFLAFNGKNIVFLSVDGTYWIPLKPICEALNINSDRSYQNLKKDPILGSAYAIQPMQVSKNGKIQGRNMTCIPEKYIYGWIFSLRSDSEELTSYKRTCYELLFNHFHGVITKRKDLLLERTEIDTQIFNAKLDLKENNENYKHLQELQNQRKTLSTQLNSIDKEVVKENQTEMDL